MTRVLGGSVVMRMLLPPLLTVVVDRSSAPASHSGNYAACGHFDDMHEEMPATCRAMCNVTVEAVDLQLSSLHNRVHCMRQIFDSSPGRTPSAEVDDSTDGANRRPLWVAEPALSTIVPMTTRAISCSRRTPTAAARRHCLLHDVLRENHEASVRERVRVALSQC